MVIFSRLVVNATEKKQVTHLLRPKLNPYMGLINISSYSFTKVRTVYDSINRLLMSVCRALKIKRHTCATAGSNGEAVVYVKTF